MFRAVALILFRAFRLSSFQVLRISVRRLHFTERNTGLSEKSKFPELGSAWKAAHIKVVIWYMANMATKIAETSNDFWRMKNKKVLRTEDQKLKGGACCVWALQSALEIMDRADLLLTVSEADQVCELFVSHLMHWQGLRMMSSHDGVKRWKLRPKHHLLEELAFFVKRTRINCRHVACFNDEAYLGSIKQISVQTNSCTVLMRTFQRLILNLGQRWHDAREEARQSVL